MKVFHGFDALVGELSFALFQFLLNFVTKFVLYGLVLGELVESVTHGRGGCFESREEEHEQLSGQQCVGQFYKIYDSTCEVD